MTKQDLMALADAYAKADCLEHHALENGSGLEFEQAIEENQKARDALESALDEVCMDIRIERDALRQAWEGSKQIIKMLEADKDGARYRLLRNANDYQRARLANYGRDALDEQIDILLGGQP